MRPYIIHMTGDQLQQALDELGWSIEDACRHFDQERRRVQQWLHDDHRIPRWVVYIVTLAAMPGGAERVHKIDQHLLRQQHEQTGGNPQC